MFTGIIKNLGTIVEREARAGDEQLTIAAEGVDAGSISVGDSVAVSGVCLTAAAVEGRRFAADISKETLSLTTLGGLAAGDRVNLELPLRAGEPLGGHMVSGHVDGIGVLEDMTGDASSWRLIFSAPQALARYIAPKGSVALDGISFTVNEVAGRRFGVNIIPYTMDHTTLGKIATGDRINIEIDIIARYLARLSGQE
jgi:riboflavin synthase